MGSFRGGIGVDMDEAGLCGKSSKAEEEEDIQSLNKVGNGRHLIHASKVQAKVSRQRNVGEGEGGGEGEYRGK